MFNGQIRKAIPVSGMDCASCVLAIEKELKKLSGVREANVNYLLKKVFVTYDPHKVELPLIEKKIEDLGYRISYKKYESFIDRVLKKVAREKLAKIEYLRSIEDHEFDNLALKSSKPVAVVFASPNCPSCKALKSRLENIMANFADKMRFYEMNTEKTTIWKDRAVLGLPTLIYFKNGSEVGRQFLPEKEEIEKKIKNILNL